MVINYSKIHPAQPATSLITTTAAYFYFSLVPKKTDVFNKHGR